MVETVASMFEVILVNKAAHLIAVVNGSLRSVLQNAYRLIGLVVCLASNRLVADVLSYDDMTTRERLALRAFFQKRVTITKPKCIVFESKISPPLSWQLNTIHKKSSLLYHVRSNTSLCSTKGATNILLRFLKSSITVWAK